jgi:hypothetical protein
MRVSSNAPSFVGERRAKAGRMQRFDIPLLRPSAMSTMKILDRPPHQVRFC